LSLTDTKPHQVLIHGGLAINSWEALRYLFWRWHENSFNKRDISLERNMPILPSGRRIEFSLDRFHTLLERMDHHWVREIAGNLNNPDDLLFVLDAVHFSLKDGSPYFAGYVATDWMTGAADWSTADRQALQAWFASCEAREARAEAIDYIKGLWLEHPGEPISYPYLVQSTFAQTGVMEGSRLRQ
jgi:hypothetical protein